jgi:hypothetical protein
MSFTWDGCAPRRGIRVEQSFVQIDNKSSSLLLNFSNGMSRVVKKESLIMSST